MSPYDPAPFSLDAQAALAALVAQIIPASEDFDQPGANDPAIFDDILRTAAPLQGTLSKALASLRGGQNMDAAKARAFRAAFPREAELIQTVTVQCYYRDARVMRALNIPLRPPFPEGYPQAPNDLSLLDPVRARGEIYRKLP